MGKKKKIIITIVSIILIIALVVSIIAIAIHKKSNDIVLYDNVKIITQNDTDKIPIEVKENELVFDNNQNFSNGDIIVAGILPTSSNGFIRKVVSTDTENGKYVVKTDNAYLSDVFERVHMEKYITLSENKALIDDSLNNSQTALVNYLHTAAVGAKSNSDNSTTFSIDFDEKLTDYLSVNGNVELTPILDIKLDIENNQTQFSMSLKNVTEGEMNLVLSDGADFEKQINIYDKDLEPIEFSLGSVPVVITNNISSNVVLSGSIDGSITTGIKLNNKFSRGFAYDSNTGKVTEINENYSKKSDDNIVWNTETEAEETLQANISLSLTSKLYDTLGGSLTGGIIGKESCNVYFSKDTEFNGLNYAGNVNLSIVPYANGEIIVDIPLIDENLISQTLFSAELKPLWEKNWVSSGNWQKDMLGLRQASIDKNSNEYLMYHDILMNFQNDCDMSKDLTLCMFRKVGNNQTYRAGDILGLANAEGATLVYYLRDINEDGIPELFIGKKEQDDYSVLAVYSYQHISTANEQCGYFVYGLGYYHDEKNKQSIYLCSNNELLVKYNTDDNNEKTVSYDSGMSRIINDVENPNRVFPFDTNNLDWKPLEEFSPDLKNTFKKEVVYSTDGVEINAFHKMTNQGPIIKISGENNTDNQYWCDITGVMYSNKYQTESGFEIKSNQGKFSETPMLTFRTEDSLNQKGYTFTVAVRNNNGELVRKTYNAE